MVELTTTEMRGGGVLSAYRYGYDAEGSITSEESEIEDETGAVHARELAFTYTPDGKLASCTEVLDGARAQETYDYDAAGNRVRLHREGDRSGEVTFTYDEDDRLIRSQSTRDGACEYTYDAAGRLVSKTAEGEEATEYLYGVEDRLEAVSQGGRLLMAATYDGDGNRVMQTSIYHTDRTETLFDAALTAIGQGASGEDEPESGAFDAERASFAPDEAHHASAPVPDLFWHGFILTGGACLASVNPATIVHATAWLRALLEDALPKHADELPLRFPDYALGQLSRLGVSERDRKAASAALGVIPVPYVVSITDTNYDVVCYASSSVTEVSQVMASTSTRTGTAREVYGIERLASVSETSVTSYMTDGRGSVVQTIEATSVTSWHAYTPFGEQAAGTALGETPTYGFNAEEYNPTTHLQYLRARYYQPDTGAFGVADTLLGTVTSPLTLNRYLYCSADPVNFSDPSGHLSRPTGYGKRVVPSTPASLQRQSPEFRTYRDQQRGSSRSYIAGRVSASVAQLAKKVVNANQQVQATRSAMIAASNGDAAGAAYYYAMAAQLREEYYQIYCVAADYMGYIPLEKPVFPDWVHTGLSLLGTIPMIGAVFDIVDGVLYLAEGNVVESGLSFLSAIPGFGDAIQGVKLGAEGMGFLFLGLRAGAKNTTSDVVVNPYLHKYPSPLEKGMRENGIEPPFFSHDTHHIVAQGAKRAQDARDVFEKYGISVQNYSNGVYLPKVTGVSEAAYHPSLHTKAYYDKVNDLLMNAESEEEVIGVLNQIANDLLNNTF